MNTRVLIVLLLFLLFADSAVTQMSPAADAHQHHAMRTDDSGMVMNENVDRLPRDCPAISRDYHITVQAGREYSSAQPGMIFGMDQPEVQVEACSRVEITFINNDEVRHQWMVHGLPKYLYPAGMFHIEVAGGAQKSGTFIVPGEDKTYLIHCDLPQHMEKGMRAQLVVGKGSGSLWAVPLVSDYFFRSDYLPENVLLWSGVAAIFGFLLAYSVLILRN